MCKITINYCCRDCGNLIDDRTALHGKGRCNLCYYKVRYTSPSQYKNMVLLRKAKIGTKQPHKYNCQCPFCKAHRGEMKGQNNNNWKNGISKLPYSFDFTKELKYKIRKRDKFKCQNCNISEKKYFRALDIHHIDYNKLNCKENNLITLCVSCNALANFDRDYWFAFYTYKMEETKC